jgi:hypothetical protein
MTRVELDEWVAQCKVVDHHEEFDERGNCHEWRIYESNGQLYRLSFCNGHPCETLGAKGYIRGVYEPRKVIRETKVVEVTRYHEAEKVSG